MPQVAIFIGPPGSGKDTQAELLSVEYGFTLVPTSQIIRAQFAEHPDDPMILQEKQLFDAGKLNTSEWVAGLVLEFVRARVAEGKSVVLAGSPRNVPEVRVELEEFLTLFGVHGIGVFHLQLSELEARARIAKRRFCRANNHTIPGTPEFAHLTVCPHDQSEFFVRPLDDVSLQDVRFAAYRELTEPCLAVLAEAGCAVHAIDASKTIQSIHQDIVGILERQREPTPTL